MLLKRPKMVLFDFGGTLITEGKFSAEGGAKGIVSCLIDPPENAAELFVSYWNQTNAIISKKSHEDGVGLEVHLQPLLRTIFNLAGFKTNCTPAELEIAFHRGNATHFAKESIGELLDLFEEKGIRTGVISNLVMSADALTMGIDDEIPNQHFEFIMTSADQVFCKPCPIIFQAAAGRANLPTEECWYCGNDFKADVRGSTGAGMFAVFYDKDYTGDAEILSCETGEYLHIGHWDQLIELVKEM